MVNRPATVIVKSTVADSTSRTVMDHTRGNGSDDGVFVNFSTPQRRHSRKSLAVHAIHNQQQYRDIQCSNDALPPTPARLTAPTSTIDSTASVSFLHPQSQINDAKKRRSIAEGISVAYVSQSTWSPTANSILRQPGYHSFANVPTLVSTPWEMQRQKAIPVRTSSRKFWGNIPKLPPEIYECIVAHLESIYATAAEVDVLSLQDDLRSLCLADKQWYGVASSALYARLWLPSDQSLKRKKRWSLQQSTTHLRQLCNVLRSSPRLASYVNILRPTHVLATELETELETGKAFKKGSATAVLEEIIALSPSLESFEGFPWAYYDPATKLSLAMSQASRLKSHSWILDYGETTLSDPASLVCLHDRWTHLETLVLSTGAGLVLGEGVVLAILAKLPSLQHLVLAGLDRLDCSNDTLRALPALKSLRLENIDGITDRGIEQLADSALVTTLHTLLLVDLELVNLKTIQTLFSHLTQLRRFVLVQDTTPIPSIALRSTNWDRTLRSSTLQDLHWDCLLPGSAVSALATALDDATAFPRLRRITAPCDYDGLLQNLCRPIAREPPSDADRAFAAHSAEFTARYERSLPLARVQAQLRIERSQLRPMVNVVVQDEATGEKHTHVIGSFLGRLDSQVEYCLEAAPGSDSALMGLGEVFNPLPQIGSGGWERTVWVDGLF